MSVIEPGEPEVKYLSVTQALTKVLAAMPAIGKDSENTEQGFRFRGIDTILSAAKPLLAEHGVIFVPDVIERIYNRRPLRNDRFMHEVNLHIRYRIYGPDGSHIEASAWGEGTDMGDKSTPKAHTGAYKAVLLQVLAVADAATDPDHGSPEETVGPSAPPRSRVLVELIKSRPEAVQQAIKTRMGEAGLSFTQSLTAEQLDVIEAWERTIDDEGNDRDDPERPF